MSHPSFDAFIDDERHERDVPPGEAFSAWRLKVLSPEDLAELAEPGTPTSLAQLAYLAWYNLLAPTSHNTVPQRFRLRPQEGVLEVWLDRQFVLPASDVVGRQGAVSVGCGIANSVLAAHAYGWASDVEFTPTPVPDTHPARLDAPRYAEIARIRFHPWAEPPRGDGLLRAMLARKVVRAVYDERVKLDSALAESLAAIVRAHAGLTLHLLTDSPTLLFLGKFQELADTTVFNRESFATELGDYLLPNDSASLLGMRGSEFGLGAESAHHIHLGLRRLAALLPDEMAGFAKAGNLGMRSSSAVGVITVDEDTLPQRVRAGQAYEEIAIMLQQHRFCTAMHAGITEVEAPSMALRGRLRTRARPTVVFRLGRPLHEEDWSRPHSSRPSLASTLLPFE